nr:MAG: hypothetical protein [uncultured cyanophage]WFD61422.1 MAG: hypothetical protein [uncultured cyanophage]
MKFLISQTELANSIELASKAIQNRPSHPILANILVKATEDDHIQVSGFDLSMSIEVKCPANVIDLGMGGVTLPAGMFNSVISLIQPGDLTIEIDENAKAIIKSSTGTFEIQGLDTEEYPELPVLDGNAIKRFELPVKALLSGIKTVALCCSKEESKQILCGINIRFCPGDKSLVFASTDGHQLMVVTNSLEDFEHEFELTIPLRTLTEVVRVAEKYEDDMVQVSVDSSMISFSIAGRKITSRLMDGTYPAYQTLIPPSFTSEVIVDTRSLIGVLERNLNYSKEGQNIVDCKIDVTNQELSFTTEIASVGKSDESIPAQISGEPPALLSVSAMYLLKGLKSKGFVSSSEVIIKMNGALTPVIIQPLGKSSVSHMIMPVSRRQ